ncbi:hypothetical protein HF086_012780 [Spodoptera exigua]|uniref:Uncharacterized protein n=1 Tax=Spodoptera exigua TaxID=7107 RepID=A0A922MMM5_SPOEX|nr:hypothetical protein HF086_012780 [Spodoptera exigua]
MGPQMKRRIVHGYPLQTPLIPNQPHKGITHSVFVCFRNKESLMKMWEKLKSDSKKYYAQLKNKTTQTGGGPLIFKIDPVLEQVCGILGRGYTGILGVSDCDTETMQETEKVRLKVFCTQDEFWQPAVEINTQTIGEPKNLEVQEEMPDKTQLQINEFIVDGNLAEEPKAGVGRKNYLNNEYPSGSQQSRTGLNIKEQHSTPINKTPLKSRRRPQISTTNERYDLRGNCCSFK